MKNKIFKRYWLLFLATLLTVMPFALAEQDENLNLLQGVYYGTIAFFSGILKPLLIFFILIIIVLVIILIAFFIKKLTQAITRLG
jgi:hypothetical protein